MKYTAVKNCIQYQIISYHYTMIYTYKHIKHTYIYIYVYVKIKTQGVPADFTGHRLQCIQSIEKPNISLFPKRMQKTWSRLDMFKHLYNLYDIFIESSSPLFMLNSYHVTSYIYIYIYICVYMEVSINGGSPKTLPGMV